MRLEEEIKQSKFNSEYHKLIVNIIYTGNWIEQLTSKFLKRFNLTPQQYNILRILRGQYPQPSTVFLLQDRMIDKMSNASRLVEKLRKKGLVERHINYNDRRRVDVILNENGINLLATIDKEMFEEKFKNINPDEAEFLNNLLDKFRY